MPSRHLLAGVFASVIGPLPPTTFSKMDEATPYVESCLGKTKLIFILSTISTIRRTISEGFTSSLAEGDVFCGVVRKGRIEHNQSEKLGGWDCTTILISFTQFSFTFTRTEFVS